MTVVKLIIDGEGCWPDAIPDNPKMIDATGPDGSKITFAGLPRGTRGGKPTVTIRIDLPDGRFILTETTLQLLKSTTNALVAVYGDQL